jgi:hypothetical protein
MITPAQYEDSMLEDERNGNIKCALKDTVLVLKQYGYDAGAEVLERIIRDDRKGNI